LSCDHYLGSNADDLGTKLQISPVKSTFSTMLVQTPAYAIPLHKKAVRSYAIVQYGIS